MRSLEQLEQRTLLTRLLQFGDPEPIFVTDRWINSVEYADVDGDGSLEMFIFDRRAPARVTLAAQGPEGSFEQLDSWMARAQFDRHNIQFLAISDLDGSGISDLVLSTGRKAKGVRIEQANGVLRFVEPEGLPEDLPDEYLSANEFADLNQDGQVDLVTHHRHVVDEQPISEIEVLFANDDWTLQDPVRYTVELSERDCGYLALGDVNGDGFIDIVRSKRRGRIPRQSLEVLLNDGSGAFSSADPPITVESVNCREQLVDVNADGHLDLWDGAPYLSAHRLGNGDGTFGSRVRRPDSAFAYDVDGDGALDFVGGNVGDGLDGVSATPRIYFWGDDGEAFPLPTEWTRMRALDLVGDARAEFVFHEGNTVYVTPQIESQFLEVTHQDLPNIDRFFVEVNRDGIEDVLFLVSDGFVLLESNGNGDFDAHKIQLGIGADLIGARSVGNFEDGRTTILVDSALGKFVATLSKASGEWVSDSVLPFEGDVPPDETSQPELPNIPFAEWEEVSDRRRILDLDGDGRFEYLEYEAYDFSELLNVGFRERDRVISILQPYVHLPSVREQLDRFLDSYDDFYSRWESLWNSGMNTIHELIQLELFGHGEVTISHRAENNEFETVGNFHARQPHPGLLPFEVTDIDGDGVGDLLSTEWSCFMGLCYEVEYGVYFGEGDFGFKDLMDWELGDLISNDGLVVDISDYGVTVSKFLQTHDQVDWETVAFKSPGPDRNTDAFTIEEDRDHVRFTDVDLDGDLDFVVLGEQGYVVVEHLNPGDFDGDGIRGSADYQLLFDSFGDVDGENQLRFDMNRDSVINEFDLQFWLKHSAKASPGDLNLDGRVDDGDFQSFAKNFGMANAFFADGDFDGDGKVTFADFLLLAGEFQTDANVIRLALG